MPELRIETANLLITKVALFLCRRLCLLEAFYHRQKTFSQGHRRNGCSSLLRVCHWVIATTKSKNKNCVLSSKDQVVIFSTFSTLLLHSAGHIVSTILPHNVCTYLLTCKKIDREGVQCTCHTHWWTYVTYVFCKVMESPFQLKSVLKLRGHCSHLGGPVRNVYLKHCHVSEFSILYAYVHITSMHYLEHLSI